MEIIKRYRGAITAAVLGGAIYVDGDLANIDQLADAWMAHGAVIYAAISAELERRRAQGRKVLETVSVTHQRVVENLQKESAELRAKLREGNE